MSDEWEFLLIMFAFYLVIFTLQLKHRHFVAVLYVPFAAFFCTLVVAWMLGIVKVTVVNHKDRQQLQQEGDR